MLKFKIWIMQRFYRVGLWWWKWWSLLYRFLFHRKYKKIDLDSYLTPFEVQTKLDKLTWTKDGTRELWDSCGSPHWVQYVLGEIKKTNSQPEGALDCDDFTSWAAAVIEPGYNPRIFSFTWVGRTFDTRPGNLAQIKKIQGHAMCLLVRKDTGQLLHVGNWGVSSSCNDLHSLCLDIMTRANGTQAIGWALMDKKLNVLDYGTGMPDKGIK